MYIYVVYIAYIVYVLYTVYICIYICAAPSGRHHRGVWVWVWGEVGVGGSPELAVGDGGGFHGDGGRYTNRNKSKNSKNRKTRNLTSEIYF